MANSTPAKKAAAAPAKPAAQTDTAHGPTPSVDNPTETNTSAAEERQAQTEAAEEAVEKGAVEAGPKPGSDEFVQQYTETLNQLSKTADPVEAPEGTPEHTAYEAPAKAKK